MPQSIGPRVLFYAFQLTGGITHKNVSHGTCLAYGLVEIQLITNDTAWWTVHVYEGRTLSFQKVEKKTRNYLVQFTT